jgi:FMN phosphatase YigB (HAD superfamily)
VISAVIFDLFKTLGEFKERGRVIGDDPYFDIHIPKSLGMKIIHITAGKVAPETDAKAQNLGEAVKVVEKRMKA